MLLAIAGDEHAPEELDESRLKSLLEDAKKDLDETFQDAVVFQLDEQEIRDLDPDGLLLSQSGDPGSDVAEEILKTFNPAQENDAGSSEGQDVFAFEPPAPPSRSGPEKPLAKPPAPRRTGAWVMLGIAAGVIALVTLQGEAVFESTGRYGSRLLEAAHSLLDDAGAGRPAQSRPPAPESQPDGVTPVRIFETEPPAPETVVPSVHEDESGSKGPDTPALADESILIEAAATEPADSPAVVRYAVHTDSFRSRFSAEKELARLQDSGYPGYLEQTIIADRGAWFRVMIGPFSSRDKAGEILNQLKSAGKQHPVIMTHPHKP